MDDIDSIVMFEGKAAEAPASVSTGEVETKVETTASPAVPENKPDRDEHGKFKAKEATTDTPVTTATQTTEPEKAPEKGQLAALLAERGRRHQVESENARLKAQLAQGGQTESPDFLTDPQAAIREGVQREIAPLRNRLFLQSIESAGAAHKDYEEVISHFLTLAEENPALRQQFVEHENPGEFAYVVGSSTPQYREQREKTYTDKISSVEAENATLKAQLAELQGAQKKLSEIPESLNRQPSGPVPVRQDESNDIKNLVRFK